ncbi:MAG TPA: efflux transporter outer membrane subunit [Usitatibacteraceae bacterium]|nr:efflux transporter outer membrane subunit [Usitatibacteraceae bacterium]
MAILLTVAIAGCATQADRYERPAVDTPARWSGRAGTDAWPDRNWWSAFGSPELDALIGEAQAANHDVRAAAARVGQARANAGLASAGLFPVLSLGFDGQRSKDPGKSAVNSYALGPQASYEVDLWGRLRDTARAGDAALLASEFDRETVRLGLTADVANAYFQLLSLNDRIRVAEENVVVARRLLDLLSVQQQAGRVSTLEVERQRSLVASTEAAIPPLRQQRVVTRDALAVLLGRPLDKTPDPKGSLRTLAPPAARGGVPAQLVERRPDIRRAEADLMAANANVGAARGALFPNLTLAANGGTQAGTVAALFGSGTGYYALAAALVGTIFDGGARRARVDLSQAQREERVEFYLQAVVSSFRDVEDALAGIEQFAVQEDLLVTAAKSAREAYRIVDVRYREGAENFFNVLDAQRTLLSAESAVDQARLARFAAATGLYRALGGGWDGRTETPLAQATR